MEKRRERKLPVAARNPDADDGMEDEHPSNKRRRDDDVNEARPSETPKRQKPSTPHKKKDNGVHSGPDNTAIPGC